jgi:CRISPR/Cas system Type II protein with McrA/HNH and RuvC-like nuclease domain
MKKILGLDIGTTSIGWAIVEATDEKKVNEKTNDVAATDINNDRIGIHKDAIGVRIISQDTANILSFNKGEKMIKGSTLTPTANRRVKRSSRRLKSRYKLRRQKLNNVLAFLNIVHDEKYYTNERKNDANGKRIKRGENNDIGKAIYELRDKAIREKISLPELGRILLHLNQWRGYSSDRFAIEEKPKFNYAIAELIEVDLENKIAHFDKDKKGELRYYQIAAKIKFEEEYNLGDVECPKFVSELSGFIFKREIDFKQGDFITIKAPEFKQEKKGKSIVAEYYKLTLTSPDPTDWNYKYQTLQKTLTEWCNEGKTLGSYFYHNFYKNKNIDRIRNNVVNRNWYEHEFDKIWELQFENHKDFFEKIDVEEVIKVAFKDYVEILNEVKKEEGIKEQLKSLIKDKIIFFQRPWQQAKNKGQCPFEKILVKKEKALKGAGKKEIVEVHIGRTVIPRSHPLFQDFKIWQQINNVRLYLNTIDEKIDLFADADIFRKYVRKEISEVKQLLYDGLQKNKILSWRTFVKDVLGLKTFEDLEDKRNKNKPEKKGLDTETGELANEYFSVNFRKRKKDGTWEDIKLKGNTTKVSLQAILKDKFNEWFDETHSTNQSITNLQLLWEIIYDITNSEVHKVAEIIENHFRFEKAICLQLSKIKFDDAGMGNLSAKAIRHILPMMSNGNNLTEKAKRKIDSLIVLNKSEAEKGKNKDEKLEELKNFIIDKKARFRLSQFNNQTAFKYLNYWEATAVMYGSHSSKSTIIKSEISRVENHSMNNPVVEKIVNETISIVNEIYKGYGFDEVRIELSRELKASMDERAQMWESMNNNAEKNEWAKQMLRELKKALIEGDRDIDNIDNSTSTNSNLDKIKIIEDAVKYQYQDEYKKKFKEFKLDDPSKSETTKYLLWLEQNFKCPYTDQPIPLTDVFAIGNVVEIEHIIPKERYYLNSYSNKVITWRAVNQAKANNGNRTAYEFICSKRVEDSINVGGRSLPLVAKEKWEDHVKSMFPKGGKRTNLLRKDIPEDPINRTLNETQFINKKLKEKLAELVGEQKVWVTSGAVTDILRERWHLNDIVKELLRPRFENFEIPTGKKTFTLSTVEEQEEMADNIRQALGNENFEFFKIPTGKTGKQFIEIKDAEVLKKISEDLQNRIRENTDAPKKVKPYKYSSSEESFETKSLIYWTTEYNSRTRQYKEVEKFEGFSKRLDHRHHAIDAIIVACTKQNHIQYINSLNAINSADRENDESKKAKYAFIKSDVCIGDSSKRFVTPWNNDKFIVDVKNAMNKVIISHKNTRLLISPSKNKYSKSKPVSIRGELHGETNYAKKNYFEDEVNARVTITKVIPLILESKMSNQMQSKVHFKKFNEVIREIVLNQ